MQHGRLPIHLAASEGQCDIIELLVKHGALVNVTDADGEQPIHQALRHGHVKAAEHLIACGAFVTQPLWVCSFPFCHCQSDAFWSLTIQCDTMCKLKLAMLCGISSDVACNEGRSKAYSSFVCAIGKHSE